jgi:hypothetical protein
VFRSLVVFGLLLAIRTVTRVLYRIDVQWVEPPPESIWRRIRLAAMLNHTSLYEWLYIGAFPAAALWQLARRGVIPVADKTMKRPLVGRFIGLVAHEVVSITRRRDETWESVVGALDDDSLVFILPEGRMKRASGLDAEGKPMTVRGGIADLVEQIPEGLMLLMYSAGLHHVQVPGEQSFPRLFRTLRLRLQAVEIAGYRHQIRSQAKSFRLGVARDLESRRDRLCPPQPEA